MLGSESEWPLSLICWQNAAQGHTIKPPPWDTHHHPRTGGAGGCTARLAHQTLVFPHCRTPQSLSKANIDGESPRRENSLQTFKHQTHFLQNTVWKTLVYGTNMFLCFPDTHPLSLLHAGTQNPAQIIMLVGFQAVPSQSWLYMNTGSKFKTHQRANESNRKTSLPWNTTLQPKARICTTWMNRKINMLSETTRQKKEYILSCPIYIKL